MSQDIVEGWALIKRGLYWRPDAQGYTGLKSEAGCYSDADASGYSEHGDGTTKMRWADAPELAPSCSDESARRYYATLITTLTAERDALAKALEPFAKLGEEAAWMTKPDDKGAWGFDGATLTWGDFRRARAVVLSLGAKQ